LTDKPSRKLAVIMHADVVGSTRLVQKDESFAHERIRGAFQRLAKTAGNYGGIAHEIRGDALVAEFSRASDAVCAALAFQIENTELNAAFDDDIRPEVRIGISLGEVVVADGTVTGTGVILAQRLEQLAKAGGVVVQGSVSETVLTRLPFDFESLGEQSLKGFEQPVRAFVTRLQSGKLVPEPESNAADPAAMPALSGAFRGHPHVEMPDKPSIAVLPFNNLSGDPEQEYFADGIVEDIITGLSRFDQLFVIARNSSFTFKNQSVDVRDVAVQLGVRYVLEGSVRRSANRIRITGQLIDADSGAHLWADHYDGELDDVFDLQDRITEAVVGVIEPAIRKADYERVRRKHPESLDAYDLYLKALPLCYQIMPEGAAGAFKFVEQAIQIAPSYAPALALSAWCLEQGITRDWPPLTDDDRELAGRRARAALSHGADDANVIAMAGFALQMTNRDFDTGIAAARRALKLNPNSALTQLLAGVTFATGGDPELGSACCRRAMALSPMDPMTFLFLHVAALSAFAFGRYEEAIDSARESIALNSDRQSTYWLLASACAHLGQMEEAKAAIDKLLAINPDASVSQSYNVFLPFKSEAVLRNIIAGLKRAGLSD